MVFRANLIQKKPASLRAFVFLTMSGRTTTNANCYARTSSSMTPAMNRGSSLATVGLSVLRANYTLSTVTLPLPVL